MSIFKLDESLVAMIEANERVIRGYLHHAPELADADIDWDGPSQLVGDEWTEDDADLNHAIGFLSGVAAAFDVTPLELLDIVHQYRNNRAAFEEMYPPMQAFPRMLTRDERLQAQGFSVPSRGERDSAKRRRRIRKVK